MVGVEKKALEMVVCVQLLMDGSEMNDYEAEPDLDNCFMKLMNEFGNDTMSDDEEEEEDPTHGH